MNKSKVKITDKDIDQALARARLQPPTPRAISAEYNAGTDTVVLRSDMGHHLVIPRKEIQGLENGTEAQLSKIDIYCGADIDWPELGVNHYFEHLLEGKYASEKWKKARQEHGVAA